MQPYNLRCKKFTESKNKNVSFTSDGKVMLPAHCVVCKSKKRQTRFIKYKEASVLLSMISDIQSTWWLINLTLDDILLICKCSKYDVKI